MPAEITGGNQLMTDERNVAHDKQVMQEKQHDGEDLSEGTVHAPQPGKKPAMEKDDRDLSSTQQDTVKADA